jgi:hypothetical protein
MNLSKIRLTDILAGLLYIVCFVFGYAGFTRYYAMYGEEAGFWTKSFQTLQLFIMESAIEHDKIPVMLNITRFMAPVLLAGTILNLFLGTVIRRANLFIIKYRFKEHIIFCGLGYKSFLLIQDYLKAGDYKIVVIEKDHDNLLAGNILDKRVRFIYGNAEDPKILKLANVRKTTTVFALTENDKTNINITHNIIDIFNKEDIENKLKIILHVSDHFNMNIFKEFQERSVKNIDFHAFNIYQKIAAIVIDEYCPDKFRRFTGPDAEQCHILVHGLNRIGEQIIKEAIQLYHFADLRKPRITVVDERLDDKVTEFSFKVPFIDQIADMRFVNSPDLFNDLKITGIHDVSVCFICSETESQCYEIAKRYRQLFFKLRYKDISDLNKREHYELALLEDPRIVILLPRDPDILDLFVNFKSVTGFLHIDTFAFYTHVCNKKMIADDEDMTDNIARQIHNIYLGLEEAELMPAWEKLTDSEKDYNRYPARHLAIKLRYLNAAMVSATSEGVPFVIENLSDKERLVLAKMEHNRWIAEKILGSYMFFEEIADKKLQSRLKSGLSLHKDIQPWEELTEQDRHKDNMMTDNINTIVKALGKKLIRI